MGKSSYHGMSSSYASEKKKEGHRREDVRKVQLGEGAIVITGNLKPDIIRPDGLLESVKGGNRTQWALYSINRIKSSNLSDQGKFAFHQWVNFLPENKNEYLKNKIKFSKNPNVKLLYQIYKDEPMTLIKYFCGYDEIDYYTLMDKRDGSQLNLEKELFFNRIESSITRTYTTEGGKFSIAGGPKDVLLFELELRKGKNSHRCILFVSTLKHIIDIFK
jgi:hypothetical protein